MSPRTANRPSITLEQIVASALKLIDESGLARLSMRALAKDLGVDVSTIYYYVPSKSKLSSLIVDQIMSGMDLTFDDPNLGTAERLVAASQAFRTALMTHPRALPLVAARSLHTSTQLAGVELILGILHDAGFSPLEALAAVNAVGQTMMAISSLQMTQKEAEPDDDDVPWGGLDEKDFPNLHKVMSDGVYLGLETEFEIVIRSLISGIIAAQASGTLIPPDTERLFQAAPTPFPLGPDS